MLWYCRKRQQKKYFTKRQTSTVWRIFLKKMPQNLGERANKAHIFGRLHSLKTEQAFFLCKVFGDQTKETCKMTIKRGEIYYADLNPVVGSEQGGVRPIVVLQNDVGNKYSPTVIAAATTSKLFKAKLPTHIEIAKENSPLPKDSVVLLEQIRTIDKSRIKEKIGELPPEIMQQINDALLLSLGF